MTVKEIVELTGKSKSVVYQWIKTLSENGKTLSGNGNYDLEETITILRSGKMSEAFISLLKENVERKAPFILQNESDKRIERLESLFEKFIISIPTIISQTVQSISSQKQLEYTQDYFTIIGYANSKGIKNITTSDAMKLSLTAKKLSIESDKEIRKVPDERWGSLNSYHVDIIKKVFDF